jgi:hypothetical protein
MSAAAKRKEIHEELGLAGVDDESSESPGNSSSSSGEKAARKKAKVDTSAPSVTMPNDDVVYTIDKLKKCSVGTFKGKVTVNIREWYVDKASGDEKPGKSGIALNVDQWTALKELVRLVLLFCMLFVQACLYASFHSLFLFCFVFMQQIDWRYRLCGEGSLREVVGMKFKTTDTAKLSLDLSS